MYWNSPLYKPASKICEEAWDEFIRAAHILLYLHHNHKPKRRDFKTPEEYEFELGVWERKSPDIYAVFNKLRQDIHNELPYSKNFITMIDKEIERELKRERAASRSIIELPKRN